MAGATGISDLDLVRIRRYCEGRVPSRLRNEIRVELEVRGRSVTIVERRAPWTPEAGPEWTRLQVARFRYLAARAVWLLDWSDSNQRWHAYAAIEPSPNVDALLEEVEADPTGIFWG